MPPRIGIVGFQMGGNHAEALYNSRIAQFAAAADINPTAKPRVELLGGHFYTDYREMLDKERLDGVIVAVPHPLHAPVAEAAAERGCHLFIEKPLAHTLQDCDRIIAAVEKYGVRALVGYHRRFSGAAQKARELVQNGALGRLIGLWMVEASIATDEYFQAQWKGSREHGGGILQMVGSHAVDLVRFVAGEITHVSARASQAYRGHTAADTLSVGLVLENGALGTFFITDTAASVPSPGLALMGSEASFTLSPPRLHAYHWPADPRKNPAAQRSTIDLAVPASNPNLDILKHFCAVIQGDASPAITLADARRTTAVLEAILSAADARTEVPVPG